MTATDTYLNLRAFVDELARCGLHDACTSPGSRSAPLVLTLAADSRLRVSSQIDERCGGFFALGAAKAGRRPVALACTSGTATANYLPAVVEAHHARVPLLVLTADRPPELRELGAGQTIDQQRLYGTATKWFVDVDDHPATPARLRWLRQLACRVYWTALGDRPGPVHVNFALREPLVLTEPLPDEEPGGGGRPDGRPWVLTAPERPATAPVDDLITLIRRHPEAVIVAGRYERDPAFGPALAAFAARAGLPLLADPLSGSRRGVAAIAHYDALLRDPDWAAERRPDLVLRIGDLPTSKPLRRWLDGLSAATPQIALDGESSWQDPGADLSAIVPVDPVAAIDALTAAIPRRARDWLERFTEPDNHATVAIAAVLGREKTLSEPRVAAELGARLPTDATLVVASSMPIRDVETFFEARDDPPRVLANRGANGIDGTTSTALGVAAASAGPTVLLTGDIAFLHDLGGLHAAREHKLTIVLLDNDGGGIFHFLPVAGAGAAFERLVATPHGLDLAHAATLFGLAHVRVAAVDQFRTALDRALTSDRSTLIHIRTERESNAALHHAIWDAVSPRAPGAARRV